MPLTGRRKGHVAEWLRNGLQNRVPRFNSGRGLHFQILSSIVGTVLNSIRATSRFRRDLDVLA